MQRKVVKKVYTYLSIHSSVYLSIHLSIHPFFCLSILLSVYLSIHLSICPFIYHNMYIIYYLIYLHFTCNDTVSLALSSERLALHLYIPTSLFWIFLIVNEASLPIIYLDPVVSLVLPLNHPLFVYVPDIVQGMTTSDVSWLHLVDTGITTEISSGSVGPIEPVCVWRERERFKNSHPKLH